MRTTISMQCIVTIFLVAMTAMLFAGCGRLQGDNSSLSNEVSHKSVQGAQSMSSTVNTAIVGPACPIMVSSGNSDFAHSEHSYKGAGQAHFPCDFDCQMPRPPCPQSFPSNPLGQR